MVTGKEVTLSEIEAAICAYPAEHPDKICIASLIGFEEVFLTGEWPDIITLRTKKGSRTVTIIVTENDSRPTLS